jgi:hypothetical protein
MVFSPGMSEAWTMAYCDQSISGENVIERMRPRAMVERTVAPCHMPGSEMSSMYCAAPSTLARPSLRRGDAPRMEGIGGMSALRVFEEDRTNGWVGAMWRWVGMGRGCAGASELRVSPLRCASVEMTGLGEVERLVWVGSRSWFVCG